MVSGFDLASEQNALYIASGSNVFIYTNSTQSEIRIIDLKEDLTLIRLVSDGHNVAGLYYVHGSDWISKELDVVNTYKFINLLSQTNLQDKNIAGIPWNPRNISDAGALDYVDTPQKLISLFNDQMLSQNQSGLMNLGGNNFEGLVAKSQVNYLNGFLALLKQWLGLDHSSPEFDNLKTNVKLRLDLEIYLLDKLLDEGNPGLLDKKDSLKKNAHYSGRSCSIFIISIC